MGVTAGTARDSTKEDSYLNWVALVLLEISFFVNAAGLFMLSGLIDKN